jgi:hypothetical protein
MFAQHPEINNKVIGLWCDLIKERLPSIELAMMGNPNNLVPLQAADLFAYEVSHCSNWNDVSKMPPGIRQLKINGRTMFVWPPN